MVGQMPASAQLRAAFTRPPTFSKSCLENERRWVFKLDSPHKMFSKLRGTLTGGCSVVVSWTLSSMSWLSAAFRPSR